MNIPYLSVDRPKAARPSSLSGVGLLRGLIIIPAPLEPSQFRLQKPSDSQFNASVVVGKFLPRRLQHLNVAQFTDAVSMWDQVGL
eukprot:4877174-Karenia_brevis.AAC.1